MSELTRAQKLFINQMQSMTGVRPDEIASWMTNASGEQFTRQGAVQTATALARKGLLVIHSHSGRTYYALSDRGRALIEENPS